ncbi:unnamed protein product [Closterium sp. Yama58-4]|nr:unnamed protein product [Closterium sp. Yama58-4]
MKRPFCHDDHSAFAVQECLARMFFTSHTFEQFSTRLANNVAPGSSSAPTASIFSAATTLRNQQRRVRSTNQTAANRRLDVFDLDTIVLLVPDPKAPLNADDDTLAYFDVGELKTDVDDHAEEEGEPAMAGEKRSWEDAETMQLAWVRHDKDEEVRRRRGGLQSNSSAGAKLHSASDDCCGAITAPHHAAKFTSGTTHHFPVAPVVDLCGGGIPAVLKGSRCARGLGAARELHCPLAWLRGQAYTACKVEGHSRLTISSAAWTRLCATK